MPPAEERIEQYLYAGESIREAFDVGPARIVLTSHRVFVDMPDDDGIQQADLPNVTGVERTTRGSLSGIVWGVSFGLIGFAFLAVGLTLRVNEAFTVPEFREDAATEAGAGPLTEPVKWVLWGLEHFDTLLLGGGVFFLVLAPLPLVYYWVRVRERSLAIRLAGEQPDIHLPLSYIADDDERRLRERLHPDERRDDAPEAEAGQGADRATGDDSRPEAGDGGDKETADEHDNGQAVDDSRPDAGDSGDGETADEHDDDGQTVDDSRPDAGDGGDGGDGGDPQREREDFEWSDVEESTDAASDGSGG